MTTETLRRPHRTVKLVPESGEGCVWCQATVDGQPAMHLVCRCRATNIINYPIYLLKAYIDRPFIEGDIVVKHYASDIYGTYPIFPNSTGEVAIHFFVQPLTCESGKDFNATVTVIDMYGNRHHTGKVTFMKLDPEMKPEEPGKGESVSAIQNPIERRVAEILKTEICKYEHCGKKEGGLGSVITKYDNRIIIGVGSDYRTLCSPDDPLIINDPQNARIESDNVDLLLNYYANLEKPEHKDVFRNALLKRLDRNCEYQIVGYFVALVLIKIDELSAALEVAKNDLQGDSGYGFSSFLMLLDGMLKYAHNVFSDDQLNEILIFIQDIEGHTFRISERLAAVQNFRYGFSY
jgi:hypothetical protein